MKIWQLMEVLLILTLWLFYLYVMFPVSETSYCNCQCPMQLLLGLENRPEMSKKY